MKTLLIIFALLFSGNVFAAHIGHPPGDATIQWTKPDPAFTNPVRPGTIIDEYRLYCTIGVSDFVVVIPGYDTEIYEATGLVPGSHSCFMRSYSAAQDQESKDSNVVAFIIYGDASPNPPTLVIFE